MPSKKPRSRLVAVLLSGLFPGLGQWYNGENRKALLFVVGGLLTAFGPFSGLDVEIDPDAPAAGVAKLILATLPFLLLAFWSILDAYRNPSSSPE